MKKKTKAKPTKSQERRLAAMKKAPKEFTKAELEKLKKRLGTNQIVIAVDYEDKIKLIGSCSGHFLLEVARHMVTKSTEMLLGDK